MLGRRSELKRKAKMEAIVRMNVERRAPVQQAEEDEDDELVEIMPKVIVVVRNELRATVDGDVLKIGPIYNVPVPYFCEEAVKGNKLGRFRFEAHMPSGVPTRKFTTVNLREHGDRSSTVQAVYLLNDKQGLVTYEGWKIAHYSIHPLKDLRVTCPKRVELAVLRDRFITMCLDGRTNMPTNFPMKAKPDYKAMAENQHKEMWRLEELSYFATIIHEQLGMAPVLYINMYDKDVPVFPKFAYSAVNIIDEKAYITAKRGRQGKQISFASPISKSRRTENVCESPKTCKCGNREVFLETGPDVTFLSYDANGRLKFPPGWIERSRVVVECSNVCGCGPSCPRRALQRGQQVPLVVCYELSKGFGVRALEDIKAGTLIAEYTGDIFLLDEANLNNPRHPEESRTNASYQAVTEFIHPGMVIDSLSRGNMSRFINHSCDPNAAFCEVFSRVEESDVLLPRVAAYACKPIKMGEEITLGYYPADQLGIRKGGKACLCGSALCKKWIPAH